MSNGRDKAQKRLDVANETVEQWKSKVDDLASELAGAESRLGSDALASGDLEETTRRLTGLRDRLEVARETVAAAEAARQVAEGDVLAAEAADLRRQGRELEQQAEKQSNRTRELLEELEAHEGGPFVPLQPTRGVASDIEAWLPRSDALGSQALAATQEAEQLQREADRKRAGRVNELEKAAVG